MVFSFRRILNPLFAIISSIFLIVFGLCMSKNPALPFFLAGLFVWLFIFGCGKRCLKVLPMIFVVGGIFALITYLSSGKDTEAAVRMLNRFAALFLSMVPGMSIEPVAMTRSLSQIKAPRAVTLGMLIVLSFMPVLGSEIKRVREAMKTRGAGSVLNPKILYRAFLIPLVTRLVDISDTLALSIETRGFTLEKADYTVYKKESVYISDLIYATGIIVGAVLAVIL